MKKQLNRKMLSAGLAMVVLVAAILTLNSRSINQYSEDVALSKQHSQLEQLITLIKDQANQYDQNAPRDYESYYRDLKVYYIGLQENLKQLDQLLNGLSAVYYGRSGTTNWLLGSDLLTENDEAMRALQDRFQAFQSGFQKEIGDNPEEPRLEWGNRFILNDESGLFAQVASAHQSFETLLQEQKKATVTFSWFVMAAIGLSIVMLLLWFNKIIVQRVIRVAKACGEVVQGNYGLKISDRSTDEISGLVSDFNVLSSRFQSILNLVSKLHQASTNQQQLNLVKNEINPIVNVSHLYWLTLSKGTYQIKTIASDKQQNALIGKSLIKTDAFLELLDADSQAVIDDLMTFTLDHKESHFGQFLLNELNVQSLMLMKVDKLGQQGILVLAKNSKHAFSEQQSETLQYFTPLLGTAFFAHD